MGHLTCDVRGNPAIRLSEQSGPEGYQPQPLVSNRQSSFIPVPGFAFRQRRSPERVSVRRRSLTVLLDKDLL
jgi:hypothetical protein